MALGAALVAEHEQAARQLAELTLADESSAKPPPPPEAAPEAAARAFGPPPPPPSRVSSEAELTDKMLEGLEFGPPQELNEELLARLQLDPRLGSAFAEAIAEWTREPN